MTDSILQLNKEISELETLVEAKVCISSLSFVNEYQHLDLVWVSFRYIER